MLTHSWSLMSALLLWVVSVSAETYYATPTCTEEGVYCTTLSQYASNNYFTTNTTLILLPGNHSLESELTITNIIHLTISASLPDTTVTCSPSAGFTFESIDHVSISGVTFVGCVNNTISSVNHLTVEDCNFDGQYREGTGLELESVSNATIMNSSFTDNNGGKMVYDPVWKGTVMGGGAIIVINSKVFITHCVFSGNSVNNRIYNATAFQGGAMHVVNSDVSIDDCEFINNTADDDGGAVLVYGNSTSVTIDSSAFIDNTAVYGGAVSIHGNCTIYSVTIDNSTFINNTANYDGGAVAVYGNSVTVDNCYSAFINNTDGGGSAVLVGGFSTSVTIDNSIFINNTANNEGGAMLVGSDSTSVTIDNSTFINNTAGYDGGAVEVYGDSTSVIIDNCTFINNTAAYGGYGGNGGAVWVDGISVTIDSSTFINNKASDGGAVEADSDIANFTVSCTIDNSTFINNTADQDGGAVRVYGEITSFTVSCTIDNSTFINNTAGRDGGAVRVVGDSTRLSVTFTIDNSTFINNTAGYNGGAMRVDGDSANVTIDNSMFINNIAGHDGGALWVETVLIAAANLTDITLTHNLATRGAAIYLVKCGLSSNGYLNIDSNVANSGVVYALQSSITFSGTTTVSNNIGSVFAFNSNVTLSGNTAFMNNSYPTNSTSQSEGGAITSFQSNLYFHDTVNMQYNKAENGGAILTTESKVYMYGKIRIANNRALQSGGGIYAFQTELNMEHDVTVSGNTAYKKGGGIYAISSTVKVIKYSLHFINNHAEQRGGGVCLELNTKFYIIKSQCEAYHYYYVSCNINPNTWPRIVFTDNSADYGGAVYVTDDTNSGTCSATPSTEQQSPSSECFFQVLALYTLQFDYLKQELNIINLNFFENTARVAGGTLFGGLLDRCAVSPFAEVFLKYDDLSPSSVYATSYLLNVTNLEESESDLIFSNTSSDPVRVCFCKDGQPDCSYQLPTKHVLKGGLFTVSVVAVDQVNNVVPNTAIRGSLLSGDGRLSEGQAIQQTNDSCTELQYNTFSPHDNDTLLLYAEGPCNDTGISARHIYVIFQLCPIGFQPAQEGTDCSCDPALSPYITTNCFINNQTVLREGDFWIAFVNDSDKSDEYLIHSLNDNDDGFDEAGFIIKPHCPFDYCHPHTDKVYINFNIPNGADAQCVFNRIGILCGSCGENLSLSLGSSRCMSCSNNWLALLIPFAIAGIALVAFLLVLNLTVAVGTINGMIFYANIIAANSSIFLPFDKPNFLTVFIAWLNLDFGFETCFYDGMDGYAKVWLQLVFPSYIIFLVVMVIIVCEYSHWFSRLLSYTNPVATLATLILLSYAKLLRTIIAALSFTILEYPDCSHTTVWLYDANIPYLKGKHIFLFIAAVLILLVGIVYTFLLMFWQLLLWVSDKQQVKWLSCNYEIGMLRRWYVGLQHFIDMYHAPYNTRHRYWTGLLLLLRGVLYLISADNVLGDPSVNLLSVVCAVVLLLMWKLVAQRIYKTEYLSNLDTLFLVNLCIFTAGTSYIRAAGSENQAALAYTSTSIAFITFLGILCYHTKLRVPQHLYELVKKKIHHDSHHLSIRAEECGTVEERRELVPPSPTVSETSFDGLPDRNDQDSQQDDEDLEEEDGKEADPDHQCEDPVIELINIVAY